MVGTARSKLKQFERELLEGGWEQIRPEVEVKRVRVPSGEETYILCRTTARREKEKAIRSRFSNRIEEALARLEKRIVTGRLKNRNKMERQLGRIQARHPQVADLYEMEILEEAGHFRLHWQAMRDRRAWQEAREGAYLLRTNLQADSAAELWTKYIQLTEAETAFRALKSELSIRPLFHRLERRVEAHILVVFLGDGRWLSLKRLLRGEDVETFPGEALAHVFTLESGCIVF